MLRVDLGVAVDLGGGGEQEPGALALGEVEGWEIALSLGLSLALIPVLVWLAGRIYSNAVLRSGGRIKLKEALTAS